MFWKTVSIAVTLILFKACYGNYIIDLSCPSYCIINVCKWPWLFLLMCMFVCVRMSPFSPTWCQNKEQGLPLLFWLCGFISQSQCPNILKNSKSIVLWNCGIIIMTLLVAWNSLKIPILSLTSYVSAQRKVCLTEMFIACSSHFIFKGWFMFLNIFKSFALVTGK